MPPIKKGRSFNRGKQIRKKRQAIEPQFARKVVRPGTNMKRMAKRAAHRRAVRKVVSKVQASRPRPVVRPAVPPVKIMPKKPARRPSRLKLKRKVRRATAAASAVGIAAGAALFDINTASAHADISMDVSSLESSLSELQTRSSFGEVQSEITELDSLLNRVIDLLESARDKDYRFQADLEERTYKAMSRWETVRPQVLETVQQQSLTFQERLPALNPQVKQLNSRLYSPSRAEPLIRSIQDQANTILDDITTIEDNLEDSYRDIESEAHQLNGILTEIHWALDQLSEAKYDLDKGEDLVMAVPARWDKEGKDDPEGVLYLSDKRIVFEQKEKVATKKVLFITTASELVQEVLIDQKAESLVSVKAESKGLFGHQDFLAVEFSDKKLGKVSLHIDGQDSEQWTGLIERVRSGQIESDRVSATGGLSVGDLSRKISNADILAVQNEVNALQDEMMLKDVRGDISNLENEVRSLERKLVDVRAQGYGIEKDLEADIKILAMQWDRIKKNAEKTIDHQSDLLSGQMSSIQKQTSNLAGMSSNLVSAKPIYMQIKSAIASAGAQADAAEDTVMAQYGEYADEIEGLSAHLEWINWMLEAISGASFRLLATECGVAAVEAVFEHPSWEPENGILFLTDQRLLWEDRIDKYELKIDVPMGEVNDVEKEVDQETGQEILVVSFGAKAPVPTGRFRLALAVGDDWLTMIGRARSGGYVEDRAVKISEEELERIRNAPQQCPNCGAAFTTPILRGQTEITCVYCGVPARF